MADTDNQNAELDSVVDMGGDVASAEAPPALPARTYVASITGALQKISGKGTRYADIVFTVQPEHFPADFSAIQSEPVNLHYRMLSLEPTAQARYRWRKFCDAVRVSFGREIDLNQLVGKVATIKVKGTTYQGEPRAEIEAVEAA